MLSKGMLPVKLIFVSFFFRKKIEKKEMKAKSQHKKEERKQKIENAS